MLREISHINIKNIFFNDAGNPLLYQYTNQKNKPLRQIEIEKLSSNSHDKVRTDRNIGNQSESLARVKEEKSY